ncbi:hypothetical protein Hanom_Chr01g00008351 [Helianthus anomalus]
MADSNSQHHRTVAGGTETLIDHPGSPLNVVPHNLSPVFVLMKMKMHCLRVGLLKNLNLFLQSLQNQNATNDDEDGVQNCTFTQLLSTCHFCLCETMIFFYRVIVTYP